MPHLVGGRPEKHRRLRAFPRDLVDRYFTFTVVRNPWDRAVSRYEWDRHLGRPAATGTDFRSYLAARDGLPADRWNVVGDAAAKYAPQVE